MRPAPPRAAIGAEWSLATYELVALQIALVRWTVLLPIAAGRDCDPWTERGSFIALLGALAYGHSLVPIVRSLESSIG